MRAEVVQGIVPFQYAEFDVEGVPPPKMRSERFSTVCSCQPSGNAASRLAIALLRKAQLRKHSVQFVVGLRPFLFDLLQQHYGFFQWQDFLLASGADVTAGREVVVVLD